MIQSLKYKTPDYVIILDIVFEISHLLDNVKQCAYILHIE